MASCFVISCDLQTNVVASAHASGGVHEYVREHEDARKGSATGWLDGLSVFVYVIIILNNTLFILLCFSPFPFTHSLPVGGGRRDRHQVSVVNDNIAAAVAF